MLTLLCYSKTIMGFIVKLAKAMGLVSSGGITPRIADNTKIIPLSNEYTDIPLQPEEERNNTIQFFVKPGAVLIIKRGVNGFYDQEGTFRYRSGRVTHYLVKGVFTRSDDTSTSMTLHIPRNIIEERFMLKRDK